MWFAGSEAAVVGLSLVAAVAGVQILRRSRWRHVVATAVILSGTGIIAAYAALDESAIAEVVAVNPPPSHQPRKPGDAYGPPLMNVLRVLDIPEALGCLAPRRLLLIGATDGAFDRTADLYRLAGAGNQLRRK